MASIPKEVVESTEPVKADLTTVRKYFEDGGPKCSASEIMSLKKDKATGEVFIDYDQIAIGIADGTLTYPDDKEQIERAKAREIHPSPRI